MSSNTREPGRFSGLLLCCLGFLALLCLQAWRLGSEFFYVFAADKTRGLAMRSLESGGPLIDAVIGYVGALVLLHLLAGAACWTIAVATEAAFALDRRGRRVRAVAATLFGIAWLMLANGFWFPRSAFAPPFGTIANVAIGPWPLFVVLSWVSLGAIGFVLAKSAVAGRSAGARSVRLRSAVGVAGVAGAATLVLLAAAPLERWFVADAARPRSDDRPHIILIGIDSLRCDLRGLGTPDSLTPNVDRFLKSSHRFTDAVTPLARTFPSWVSILTGRHPVTTGARINLTDRSRVNEGDTLPEIYARAGYAAVLATDEVRFSNIDQSYGYHQLIAPRIGGSDFLIGTVNDIPVANLATLLPVSRHAFPDLYGNRAAYKTYRPDAFVGMVDDQLQPDDRPTFLAVHLTLAHWPYAWATSAREPSLANLRPNYTDALREVDRQFEAVMRTLGEKGLLENAIVVVLSDHGESVGLPNDSALPKGTQDARRRMVSMFGHGTSVLGPHQYRVVLGMRAFGNALLPTAGAEYAAPVTLEDIAPTLLELTGHDGDQHFDGMSLAGLLRGEAGTHERLATRFRFTESEYNPTTAATDDKSARKIAMEAAHIYRLDEATGRFVVTETATETITFAKELAVLRGAAKLAAVRDEDQGRKFYWFDGRSAFPRVTRDPVQLQRDPEAGPLYAALASRFPGEVPAP